MRPETPTPTPTASPNGKRSRDPEDDVYFDNLNSHKRYLTEMMASSLNGLTVGDTMPETIMDSPARSESMFYLRDEMSLQYSPMSEDLDDLRYCETPMSACSSQSGSRPTSPVSPYRYKPVGSCSSPPTTSMQSEPRQRGSDTEGRFPSSPSDICHSSDLRKAALLRSVQMRAQPSCSSSFDLGFNASQEPMQIREVETRSCSYLKPLSDVQEYHAEMQSCSYMKPMDDERDYHIEKGSSVASCALSFNAEQESMGTIEGETPSCSYLKPLGDEEHRVEGCSSLASAKHVISATQEPMLSIEAEPLSCSYLKPLDDGHK